MWVDWQRLSTESAGVGEKRLRLRDLIQGPMHEMIKVNVASLPSRIYSTCSDIILSSVNLYVLRFFSRPIGNGHTFFTVVCMETSLNNCIQHLLLTHDCYENPNRSTRLSMYVGKPIILRGMLCRYARYIFCLEPMNHSSCMEFKKKVRK